MATAIWNVAEITCKKCKTNRHLRYTESRTYNSVVVDHFACKCGRNVSAVAAKTYYPATHNGQSCVLVTLGPGDLKDEPGLVVTGPGFESREQVIDFTAA